MDRFIREKALIGEESFAKLAKARVLVVGVGGVGGYVVEVLARAGVGELTLCDGDVVDISNINRQIIALSSTVGKSKCEVFKERIEDINPNCVVKTFVSRYNEHTAQEILSQRYDYIVDAIDSMQDKVHLIVTAKAMDIPIISAMGAGNRFELSDFEVVDIFSTSYDKLAKKLRKLLREQGISEAKVAYTKAECCDVKDVIGSISYMPPLAGIKIGGYVINKLIK